MNITDHLQRETDRLTSDAGPDLDRLARVARTQGTRARHRRRAGGALAAAAAVAAVGVTGSLLPPAAPPQAGSAAEPVGVAQVDVTPSPGPYSPRTARGVLAALEDLVTQQVDGTTDEYAGQGGLARLTPYHEIYTRLTLRPAGDPGASVVGINIAPPEPDHRVPACRTPDYVACHDTARADGSRLRTFETADVTGGPGVYRGATLFAADGWSVTITASNGYDGQGGEWVVTRPEPALTDAQLRELVSQPLWLGRFPASYDDDGLTLAPYDDLNGHRGEF